MDRKIRRNIRLDYINTFLTNLNMQSSIWVLYLGFCGMDLFQIGLLEGIYHATSILCEIPSGALADLVGRKRSMALGKLCVTVSCIIMLFARNFWLFALSFVIQALGNNCNSGSEEALVYDSMLYLGEEAQYMNVNGKINVMTEIAQAAATAAGGVLAERSYFLCYGACVVISLLGFLPVAFMTEPPAAGEEILKEENGSKPHGKREPSSENCAKKGCSPVGNMVAEHFRTCFHILSGDKRILKIVTYFSVIFAAHTLLFFYSQQYYFDMGYNKIEISLLMLSAGLASCLGAVWSEKIYQRLGNKTAALSAGVIAAALISCGFRNAVVCMLLFTAASFFNSVLYPVESEALNRIIPSEQRATLISVNSMFFSVVMIAAFPVAGVFADRWDLGVVLSATGILLLVFAVLWDRSSR